VLLTTHPPSSAVVMKG